MEIEHYCQLFTGLAGTWCAKNVCFVQVAFCMEIDPQSWGSKKIIFQSCDNVDELIIVIMFVIKHDIKLVGKLTVTYFK